ncbi:MAG TPA: nitrilase-related carbon-nitrogen hydrolase, partial [Chthoniobacterales bacterium]|nr:nitrilase-related carbon-nitrogen hydrolase [Chthoniobacterales bacterium]
MAGPEKSNVALVQMRCSADPDENLERAVAFIRGAGTQGADIVCLPELFRSQYFCQSEDHAQFALAEEIPGPTT